MRVVIDASACSGKKKNALYRVEEFINSEIGELKQSQTLVATFLWKKKNKPFPTFSDQWSIFPDQSSNIVFISLHNCLHSANLILWLFEIVMREISNFIYLSMWLCIHIYVSMYVWMYYVRGFKETNNFSSWLEYVPALTKAIRTGSWEYHLSIEKLYYYIRVSIIMYDFMLRTPIHIIQYQIKLFFSPLL